jgi:hypothetical protein
MNTRARTANANLEIIRAVSEDWIILRQEA